MDEVHVQFYIVSANKELDGSDGSACWYVLLVGLTKSAGNKAWNCVKQYGKHAIHSPEL